MYYHIILLYYINKCNALFFTKKTYSLVFKYKTSNIIINRVDSVRDLVSFLKFVFLKNT